MDKFLIITRFTLQSPIFTRGLATLAETRKIIKSTTVSEENDYDPRKKLSNDHNDQPKQPKTNATEIKTNADNITETYLPTTIDNRNVTATDGKQPVTYDLIDFDDIKDSGVKKSVLARCDEDISHVAPYLKPTWNFAAYANKSVTLQELLKLGVDLHRLEKMVTVPPYIMGLDFERDIKKHVMFLHENGLDIDTIGQFITKNPYIFKQDLDDMRVRLNYLEAKRFTEEMIVRIIGHNPFWLMFSTQRIDNRLGFFQKEFSLTGSEVRQLTVQQPRLITYKMSHIKMNMFSIKEEMGFTDDDRKEMLLSKPNLFMKNNKNMLETFEYLHRKMGVPTEVLVKQPGVLMCRKFRLQQRHQFLEKLGRVQFDPKKPGYVSVLTIAEGDDAEFCDQIAKCPVETFNAYLKSL